MFQRKVSLQHFITYTGALRCLPALNGSIDMHHQSLVELCQASQAPQPTTLPMMIQNNLRTVANDAFGRLTSPYPLLNPSSLHIHYDTFSATSS